LEIFVASLIICSLELISKQLLATFYCATVCSAALYTQTHTHVPPRHDAADTEVSSTAVSVESPTQDELCSLVLLEVHPDSNADSLDKSGYGPGKRTTSARPREVLETKPNKVQKGWTRR